MTEATVPDHFRLDFHASAGALLTAVSGLDIHDYDTWLRVRSDDMQAVLVLTRHNGDLVDRSVGLYSMNLGADELAALRAAVESTPWSSLTPTGDDVTAAQLTLDYQHRTTRIVRVFNARSRAFIAAIWPVMQRINDLMSTLLTRPAGVLAVAVTTAHDPTTPRRRILKLSLTNPGTVSIAITDPRAQEPADAPAERAYLQVAPAPIVTPGVMTIPPRFARLPLPALPAGQNPVQILPPGARLDIDAPWTPPGPGDYLVQGVWTDYAGLTNPVDDPLPFLPLRAADDDPAISGAVYPIRGCAFSSYTALAVK